MRVPALLMLLVLLLAGCSGTQVVEQETQDDEPVKVEGQKDRPAQDKQKKDATTGDVVGRVHDVRNQSVADAHVALLGSELFAITDKDGRFNLTASAGRHVLRITAADFRALEQEVTLVADKIIEVAVRLEYIDGRAGDRLAHAHDYWRGQATYVLMDDEVVIHKGRSPIPGFDEVFWGIQYANDGAKDRYEIPLPDGTLAEPAIVLPGTARIEVTLDWDPLEIPADHMGIGYVSAGSSDRIDMDSKPAGQIHSIDITPEMADSGHQLWSFWRFWVWLDNAATSTTDWEPTVINGPVHVKIVLHKGTEPPLEPGHRDFWEDNASLVLKSSDEVHSHSAICCHVKPSMNGFTLPDGVLVPPGTARLEFRFTWWYTEDAPVLDKEHAVKWRTADQSPARTGYEDLHEVEPVEEGADYKVYDVPVEAHQADQYYQTKTNWFWVYYQVGEEEIPMTPEKSGRRFSLEVTAYR